MAYGVDQAYLRFLHNVADAAPTVLLTIFPHDVLRNLTRNFGFLSPESGMLWLKPAFRLDHAGELELLPTPLLGRAELPDYLRDPAGHHPDDPFVWDGPEGGLSCASRTHRLWRGCSGTGDCGAASGAA